MSGSSGRRSLSFLSGRQESSAPIKKAQLARALRLESLERRELMASDFSVNHNYLFDSDINRDFQINPLDALIVINELNRTGVRQLDPEVPFGDFLLDVDLDHWLTPKDALLTVNALNNGEGVGELVEFRYQFFDTSGNLLPDPLPNNGVVDYQAGVGQTIVMRTSVKDLRAVPQGVFAAYLDASYRNEDGTSAEKAQVQWGDFFRIRIDSTTSKGNFVIRFGTGAGAQLTAPITPVITAGAIDSVQTSRAIKSAIEGIFGAGNVKVNPVERLDGADLTKFHFDVGFIRTQARKPIADPAIESSTLANATDNPTTVTLTFDSTPNPATSSDVFLVSSEFRFEDQDGAPTGFYRNGPNGILTNPATDTFRFEGFGGFLDGFSLPTAVRRDFVKVAETTFIASASGNVLFSGSFSGGSGRSVTLLGSNTAVPTELIIFPQNVLLSIVRNIQANNDTFPASGQTILEDSAAISLDVGANDQLITGTSFGVTAITQPSNGGGTVAIGTGTNPKSVTYTLAANFSGTTTFTYTITNNVGDSSTATVTVNVTPVNDAPTIKDNTYTITEDPTTPLTITAAEIFSPGPLEDSQTLTLTAVAPINGQTNGTVALTAGNVVYTPAANFFGTALFTATVTDNGSPAQTTTATITVTVTPVNDPPIAFAGPLTVAEDASLIVIGTGAPTNILTSSQPGPANESSQTLTLTSVSATSTQGGTLTTSAGVVTYRPAANFFGTDTFTYVITDNGTPALSTTGTVTVNVTPVNDAPDAVDDTGAGQFVAIGQPGITTSINPLRNDSAGPNETTDSIRIVSVGTTSAGGTVTITNNGQSIDYRPATGAVNVTDTFTYTIEDGGALRDTATINVLIIPPTLPFAVNDSRTVDEDSGATTIDVMSNDLFNATASKRLIRFTQPANGVVALVDNGTPNDSSDDRLSYDPNDNVFQTDTFTYTINDTANGSQESTGTVTIHFNETNDVPTAVDRTISGTEDTTLNIAAATLTSGLSKGPLEDAQTLRVSQVNAITQNAGTVAVQNDGSVVYTPAANFNGQFIFTYTVQDNGTTRGQNDPKTATATVTVNLAEVNDAPIAGNDSRNTNEDTPLTIAVDSLLANDSPGPANEQSQTKSFTAIVGSVATSQGGTVRMSTDGLSVVYTPKADFNGTDTFTYSVSDNGTPSLSSTATVTVAVASVNDAPLPIAISRIAFKDLPRNLVVADDIATIAPGPANEAGQTVQLTSVRKTTSTRGEVSLNADGTIRYTPAAGMTGTDTFEYTVTDNGSPAASATGTITVTIQEFVPSRVSGIVWINDNANDEGVAGTVDPNELRLGGIQVKLTRKASTANPNEETFNYVTLADGSYTFSDLGPGSYTVSIGSQLHLVDGADFAGAQGDADTIANQFTINVEAPGGINAQNYNFSFLGIAPGYGNILENLASSFNGRYPGIQQKGFYAAVSKDGAPLWSMKKEGFSDTVFGEVVCSDDGTQIFLTKVDSLHNVFTATVPRNRYVKVTDGDGNRIVRILAESADLIWSQINIQAPPVKSRHYLSSVDAVFEQQDWL